MSFKIHRVGKLRGEKVTYKDGTGCCIWTPLKEKEDSEEEAGICFDFDADALPNLKELAQVLIDAEADIYVPDPEEEKRQAEWKAEQETTWYKIKDWFEDISITISPFCWRLRTFWVSRPIAHKKMLAHQVCNGFVFGPLTVTWQR